MFMFGGNEIIIIVIVIAVLFGGSQIPKLARSLGQAQGEFKKGLGSDEKDSSDSSDDDKSEDGDSSKSA